ncbi:trimeric intracellular cation channel family protein [Thalassotalea mangrovi]|uniref:Trimeric intracellular cation channel family protein n=1 Tax=Thalassotalea mangrovi TaxID=2572245 RepID=A0A4U1BBP7_9GAMM|nr:trimeric intracellular cation channel family protein [Thalassotalea mangrovi]TKB47851.1 trimeric intracellular cation channel family protein [Thalassotalea mangrovi]
MEEHQISTFIEYANSIAIMVFALSGALTAGRYRLDPFGVIVLAAITAVGGGTIRDLIMGVEIFWLSHNDYIYYIVATAVVTMLFVRHPNHVPMRILMVVDAFGLAMFSVLSAQKALDYQMTGLMAVIMGTITGVAGGIIRDIICNQIPLLLRREVYSVVALLSASLFVIFDGLGLSENVSLFVAMLGGLLLRLAAIYWHLSLPAFAIDDDEDVHNQRGQEDEDSQE